MGFTSVILNDIDTSIEYLEYRHDVLQWCYMNVRPMVTGEYERCAWSWERISNQAYTIKFDRESDAAMFVLRWS